MLPTINILSLLQSDAKKIEGVDVVDNIYLILAPYRILLNLGSSAISSAGT